MASEHRGKFVILLMIGVALAMSGYAWWHQLQSSKRSAEFWGTADTVVVRYASQIEFVPLLPYDERGGPAVQTVTIHGQVYGLGQSVDITGSRGLVHARHALVDDLSFDWNATVESRPRWEFLLRFREQDRSVTAAVDAERGLVCGVDHPRVIAFIPKIAVAFRQKRDEWNKLAKESGSAGRNK